MRIGAGPAPEPSPPGMRTPRKKTSRAMLRAPAVWATAFAALGIALALATPAHAEAMNSFYARVHAGVASQSLGDWNQAIENEEEALRSLGLPVNFDRLGAGFPFGGEIGVRLTRDLALGLMVQHQSGSADNGYADLSGAISSEYRLSVTTFGATVTAWPTRGPVFLGVFGGAALAQAENTVRLRDYGNPSNDLDVAGDWDGSGWALSIFSGMERRLSPVVGVLVRGGFQFIGVPDLDGTITSPQLGSASGPPRNASGERMPADFHGVFLTIGLEVGGG